jgi:hypothetical protein
LYHFIDIRTAISSHTRCLEAGVPASRACRNSLLEPASLAICSNENHKSGIPQTHQENTQSYCVTCLSGLELHRSAAEAPTVTPEPAAAAHPHYLLPADVTRKFGTLVYVEIPRVQISDAQSHVGGSRNLLDTSDCNRLNPVRAEILSLARKYDRARVAHAQIRSVRSLSDSKLPHDRAVTRVWNLAGR